MERIGRSLAGLPDRGLAETVDVTACCRLRGRKTQDPKLDPPYLPTRVAILS